MTDIDLVITFVLKCGKEVEIAIPADKVGKPTLEEFDEAVKEFKKLFASDNIDVSLPLPNFTGFSIPNMDEIVFIMYKMRGM